jgi:hypothetical protein
MAWDWGRHELDATPGGPAALVSPAAFLVVAAMPGRRIPAHVRELVSNPDGPGLAFAVRRHHHWRSAAGDLVVGVWQHHEGPEDDHWWAEGDDLAVLVGRRRRFGEAWAPPARAVASFAAEAADHGPAAAAAGALGAFGAVTAHADGSGAVVGDPLGFASLVRAGDGRVTALSSSAALCARALAPAGARPTRDPLGPAWHALAPYPIGDRTGFEGVRQLPEAAVVTLAPGRAPRLGGDRAPWLRTGEAARAGTPAGEAVLDAVQATVADELRAALAVPAPAHHLDLTGGKDSRLVLAVALIEGIADRFVLRTAGPPGLEDVRVASLVADHLGLRHETGWVWPGSAAPYRGRVERFLTATCGTASIWNLKGPRDDRAGVRVSGMSGECLRAHLPVRPRPASVDEAAERIRAGIRRGSLDLVDPGAAAVLDAELTAALDAEPRTWTDPLDQLAAFNVRHRAGPFRRALDDLESDVRVWPLAAPAAVAAAFSLDAGDRQDELVHRGLMARAGHGLVDLPFAGSRWPPPTGPAPARTARAGRASRSPRPADRPGRPASSEATSLVARGQGRAHAERDALVDEVLADTANPAWAVLDRARALDARSRRHELAPHQQRQLVGAVTLALWLSL